jgi:ATP-dependent RNA helicase DeaD
MSENSILPECPAQAELLFSDLGLAQEVLLAVQMTGYLHPTQVQAEIIPHMMAGRDVLAQSQTGTGKTAAFALPILSRLPLGNKRPKSDRLLPQVLVLTPTRELALQVSQAFETYGDCLPGLRVLSIYGGADYTPQLKSLKGGVDVVVGTPGRVIDHLNRGTLRLDSLQCLVLDEADEMLNMGFQEEVEQILGKTPETKQVALFSATMPPAIRAIADSQLREPAVVTIQRKTLTAESIVQRCVFVPERDKLELLTRLLEIEDTDGVIVFTKTKDSTTRVADQLSKHGLSAAALNGDLPQVRRQQTVDRLKSGQLNILVATDVAARGLDVQRISHVFNYDLPHDGESYVHRIGRTGRAGRTGVAYIFLTPPQQRKLRLIEKVTKQPIEVVPIPKARQINIKRVERFKQRLTETIAGQDTTHFQTLIADYALESGMDLVTIAAALAHLAHGQRPFFLKDMKIAEPMADDRYRNKDSSSHRQRGKFGGSDGQGNRREFGNQRSDVEQRGDQGNRRGARSDYSGNSRGPRRTKRPASGMERYQLAVGRNDGVRPGNIVGAIANEAGISGSDIGPIDIGPAFSTIDLPSGLPKGVLNLLRNTWVAGKQLKIRPYIPQRT